MTSHQDIQINEYTLTILSVKMKVKFPCKMKLQHSGNPITEYIDSKEHSKFTFNQEVTIQESPHQSTIDFNIVLVTEKGSKYVSGLIKLPVADIEKAQGQKVLTPLTKCLDSEAYCEMKINKVKMGKTTKKISVSSTLIEMKKLNTDANKKFGQEENQLLSPKNKKSNMVETRSQINFGKVGVRNSNHDWQDSKSKGAAQTLIYRSSFLKSPKDKRPILMNGTKSRLGMDFNQQSQLMSQRQKVSNADSQVYKEGYQKLKQKYKAQTQSLNCQQSKRQQLQANQSNYKVEIMRLKLKTQQQQRIITQKNDKINQLQVVLSQINKQDLDMSFIKQENKNLEEKINMLNDTISTLKKDNLNIKKLYQEQQKNDTHLLNQLRIQLDATKHKLETYSHQTSQTLRQKTQNIAALNNQLKLKSAQIQSQRQEIYKLQAYNQNKIYQFQKTLQQQKNASSEISNELKQKIQLIEREKKSLQKQISDLKTDKEKIKTLILKAEYDKKVLQQEQKTLRTQLNDFKTLKEKHSQLQRQLSILTQDNAHLRKQLQLQAQSKQVNLQQINEQHELKLNYYKKQSKEFEDKHRLLASHKIELETQLELSNNLAEKQKRLLDAANQQLIGLKSILKENKQYAGDLQQQRLNLQNELAVANNKIKFTDHTSKSQTDKYKIDLERVKNQLQAENLRAVSLFQVKCNLQIELNKNKIQLQYHQQKIDKLFASNKQYQATIDYLNKEHESHNDHLQQQINKLTNSLKNAHQSIHSLELQKISHIDQLQSNKKQIKLNQQKITHLDHLLKSRLESITQWEEKYKNLQTALAALDNQHSFLKNDHTILKNDFRKTQKICQLKSQQIDSLKKHIEQLNQEKVQLQRTQVQLRQQLKRVHQSYVKLQMKLNSTDREYNNFKQLINRTVKTQYAKLPLIQTSHQALGNSSQDSKQQTQRKKQRQAQRNNNDSKVTVILNGTSREIQGKSEKIVLDSLSTTKIVNQLTSSILDSKSTLFKLIQHNKQLKKQIQYLKEQSQQSSNKYQFTQIELHRQLQQLQQQLNTVYSQKQQEIINYDRIVSDLNGKLHDKENLSDQLSQQIQQLQYALSSLKLDFQNNNHQNDKKVILLKQVISQLQHKIQFFKVSLTNQQDANHQLEQKSQHLKTQNQQLSQTIAKNKLLIEQLTHAKQSLENSLQSNLKQRKSLLQQLQQTQLQLNEEKNLKLKFNTLLEQEEKKTSQLKQFVNTLIKQKENIIKSQLQKSDRILQLQTQQIQLKRDIELTAEQSQRIKSELDQTKQKLRKQSLQSRQLQLQVNEGKNKLRKVCQKLQEKQKQIQMKDQIIARLDKKYKQLTQKNYKETLQLHSQIDSKYSENINITKELNQKILLLQAKIQELQHLTAKQHSQNLMLHDQILAKDEQLTLTKREYSKLELQLEDINSEYQSLQNRNSNLTQEIQTKQQQLSQFNQKIILLEAQLEALHKDKTLKLEELNLDWTRKYHSLNQENIHRLSLVQNQREMLRSQLQQKINQLQFSNSQHLNSQLGINQIKLNYHAKIKSLENDRLNTILAKNNEIKKLNDQNQSLIENIVQLQSSLNQNSQLIENLRKRLFNEEKLRKDNQEKYKTTNKLLQAQIAALNAKQSSLKTQREQVYQVIWSNERQVRKVVQNYLKKVLDQCDNNHIDKITNSSKGLESDVIKAMTNKLSTSAN